MKIEFGWERSIKLQEGATKNQLYSANLDRLYVNPGIYVFCRKWGASLVPVYVGQALNVRKRVRQQLNNLRLMMGLKNAAKQGDRVLLHGYPYLRPGQKLPTVLNAIEKAFIDRAMSDGHELVNIQGTARRTHTIEISGSHQANAVFGRRVLVDRK